VATWQQLVDAVDAAAGEPSAGWRVFELQPGSSLLASRTLQLQPGMAVVAAGAGQGRTAKVAVSCQQGVGSAFEVDLTSSSSRWVVASTKQQR
jgi:cyclopropane fatty-acyl-phospholipid synthase-like methyltransferase